MARGCPKCHLKILVSSSCCRLAQDSTTFIVHRQDSIIYRREGVPAHGATGSREHEKTGKPEPLHRQWGKGKLHWVFLCGDNKLKPLSSHFPGWLIRTLSYLIPNSAVLSDAGEAAAESRNGSSVFRTFLCTPSLQLNQLPLLPPVWAGQASHLLIWSS